MANTESSWSQVSVFNNNDDYDELYDVFQQLLH